MRVLVPCNDMRSLPSLYEAYRAVGCDVVIGVENFRLRAAEFDIVHLQFPEAFTDWRVPTEGEVERTKENLAWWRERSSIVGTVHNLMPHGRADNPMDRALYTVTYEACDVIHHLSEHSRAEIVRRYPSLAGARHIVHRPFLYSHLLHLSRGRKAARAELGVGEDDFVMAAFGHLRDPAEYDLLERGIRSTRVRRKRPFVRVQFPIGRRRRMKRRLRALVSGDRHSRSASFQGGLTDDQLVCLCEAADVILNVRMPPQLNSGILQLAMTFGTPLAAPDYGIFAEHLQDAGCALYPPGDPRGLATAIESLAAQDHAALVARNRAVAREWGWPGSLDAVFKATGKQPGFTAGAD